MAAKHKRLMIWQTFVFGRHVLSDRPPSAALDALEVSTIGVNRVNLRTG